MKAKDIPLLSRPRVLAVLPGFIPSTILTVVKPLTALHRAGQIVADIALESWVSRRQLERADVVVFSRNTQPRYGYILEAARAGRKPVIYDIDDNLFEVPLSYQRELHSRAPARLAQLERYLKAAALVRVYSEPMRERVGQLNPRVVRVDGAVDWSLLPSSPPPRDPGRIRIVYATSRRFEDDMATLFSADLRRLLAVYQGRVEVFCWGYHPPELQGVSSVHFLDFIYDYDQFFSRFARYGFEVGLAPLRNEVFYRSKSNNKFREYAACRIAGVYSDVDVYSACVEDGQTGLLVSGEPGSWFTALARLVEEPQLREQIQEGAYVYAREHYGLEKVQAIWLDHLGCVLAGHRVASLQQHDDLIPRQNGMRNRFYSFPPVSLIRIIQAGVELLSGIKTRGVVTTLRQGRQRLKNFSMLLRAKWNLSPASRCWPWRSGG